MALIDPDGKQVKFSDNQDIRNKELGILQHSFDPEYEKYIDIKLKDGKYILDSDLLRESGIKDNQWYDDLLTLSESNVETRMLLIGGDESFGYQTPGQPGMWQHGKLNNLGLLGYTLASGEDNLNSEKAEYLSGISNVNILLINTSYGLKEAVKTLAHEAHHAACYINGKLWKYENMDATVKRGVTSSERIASKSYDKWMAKSAY